MGSIAAAWLNVRARLSIGGRSAPRRRAFARFAVAAGIGALLGALLPAPIVLADDATLTRTAVTVAGHGPLAPAAAPSERTADLASALGADGTFQGAPGVAGTVDTSAWTLVSDLAAGEPPRFAPAADAVSPSVTAAGPRSALGSNGSGDGALNFTVYALAVSGTDLYVGGAFADAAGIPEADNIAKWDGHAWSALGSNGAGDGALVGGVRALAVSGTDLYVGGFFQNAAGIPEADYVAKWDGDAWSALGSNGYGDGAITQPVVALAASGSGVYVGGYFENAAGIPAADFVAKWNGSAWSALGSNGSGNGALGSFDYQVAVWALAVSGNDLYVGGNFRDAAGIPTADWIAKWNGSAWSALGSNGAGTDGALDGDVYAIAASGSDVYVGGEFLHAGSDGTAHHLAKWDGSTWSAVGSNGGEGALGMASTDVWALVASGTDLYVGGFFNGVAGITAATDVAKWNGSTWSALGANAVRNSNVYALSASGSDLYMGGDFTDAAGIAAADYVAKWNGSAWSALGSGAATSLTVSGVVSPYVAGAAHGVTVTAKDAHGNIATGYRGTITFTSTDGHAVLPEDYTFKAADAGVHTFSVTLKSAGSQGVRARDTVTSTITGAQYGVLVTPAAARTLVVSGLVSPRTAGVAGIVTVTARDAFGNVATAYRGTIGFTSTDDAADLPENYTFKAFDAGVHTFSVTLKSAGSRSVRARDTLTSTITGGQYPILVKPAAATTLVVSGLGSPRTAGVAGIITITAKDAYGNVATGYLGTIGFTSTDGHALLPQDHTFKASDAGVHTFSVTLKSAGTQAVRARDTVTSTITGLQSGIVVIASGATAISAGGDHTCAIVSGAVKCWGDNSSGQIGNGNQNSPQLTPFTVIASGTTVIAAGYSDACALVSGAVECWGNNSWGQIGKGTAGPPQLTPVTVITSGATAIAAGGYHTCAIVSGAVECWGNNTNGQIGNGNQSSQGTPVIVIASGATAIAAGYWHTCAIVSGAVKCWGANQLGQIGNGTPGPPQLTPFTVIASGATAVTAGGYHTCAIVSDAVKCWGSNYYGQVGSGNNPQPTPVTVPGLTGATAVAAGGVHTCALVSGAVKCWGANYDGQIGNGSTDTQQRTPVIVIASGATAVAAGYTHTCAIVGGVVKCWGDNSEGQVGNGNQNTPQRTPVTVLGL